MLKLRVEQIRVPLDYSDEILKSAVASILACRPMSVVSVEPTRRSLDARPRNSEPMYVLTAGVHADIESLDKRSRRSQIHLLEEDKEQPRANPIRLPDLRPVVVGAGPAGLMAAFKLAEAGSKPIVLERGERAEERASRVAKFWTNGTHDPESNVLYGEGGAGLFSDGKLTARTKERRRLRTFFQLLVDAGASEEIMIDSEPHIGSDRLMDLSPRLRQRLESMGVEFRFSTCLTGINIENGALASLRAGGEELRCNRMILAVGHSARDVYEMLARAGVTQEAKGFAVGLRLEISQSAINRAQYGKFWENPLLGSASFRLTRRADEQTRSSYTFCMCPGGRIIACASEPGMITTNGMSLSARDLPFGNAAFLVPVQRHDFGDGLFDGVEYQRTIERAAYAAIAEPYALPGLLLTDFLGGRVGSLPDLRSCHHAAPTSFDEFLPEMILRTLRTNIPKMLSELNGVRLDDAVVYAPETRSSSPVRIVRDERCESVNTKGIFPAGEGSGYAGGIVSSAIDGMKAAEALLES